ncbi:TPA: hypothetical protein ACTCWR_001086 [Neisseria meningitidis]
MFQTACLPHSDIRPSENRMPEWFEQTNRTDAACSSFQTASN